MMKNVVVHVFVFLAGLLLAQCVTNETGRQSLLLIPENKMDSLGAEAYAEISQQEKVSSNAELVSKVVTIAKSVAAASGANLNWEFKVFESKTVNAFCLPGGRIGIYSGIMAVAKTNAALAAVIGHEIAHATLHHGNERMSQGVLLQLGLQVSDMALGDSKLRSPIMAALGVGAQVGAVLPFGRFQESEADALGLRYMMRAGYEGGQAALLWQRMAAAAKSSGGSAPPAWLSTHPPELDRQRALDKLAQELEVSLPQSIATTDL
jgi:predicted Zn-dependent protease